MFKLKNFNFLYKDNNIIIQLMLYKKELWYQKKGDDYIVYELIDDCLYYNGEKIIYLPSNIILNNNVSRMTILDITFYSQKYIDDINNKLNYYTENINTKYYRINKNITTNIINNYDYNKLCENIYEYWLFEESGKYCDNINYIGEKYYYNGNILETTDGIEKGIIDLSKYILVSEKYITNNYSILNNYEYQIINENKNIKYFLKNDYIKQIKDSNKYYIIYYYIDSNN